MRLTRTEMWMAEAGIIALIACLVAALGLFATSEMPLGYRLAYWLPALLAAWLAVRLFAVFGAAVAKLLGINEAWAYLFAIPLSSAAIALGVLWMIGGFEMAMGEAFARIWPTTIAIGVGFFCLFFALYARAGHKAQANAEQENCLEDTPDDPLCMTDLHKHLPSGFPAVIALSVEDHYVRAHSAERSAMVLMSLSEAINLMPDGCGERVHRSWWAARQSVAGHQREGRDTRLILENGLEVPVSRNRIKALRDAGWLDEKGRKPLENLSI